MADKRMELAAMSSQVDYRTNTSILKGIQSIAIRDFALPKRMAKRKQQIY